LITAEAKHKSTHEVGIVKPCPVCVVQDHWRIQSQKWCLDA